MATIILAYATFQARHETHTNHNNRSRSMRSLKVTFSAFNQAHNILWKADIWHLFKVPIILTVIYWPILVFCCYYSASIVVDIILGSFTSIAGLGHWMEWLLNILLFLLLGFLGLISFRSVVLIFYSIYLDGISEKVEGLLGEKIECERTTKATIKRIVIIAALTISISFLLLIVNLLANVIPVVGGVLAFAILFPVQMFVMGTGYVDPFLDRAGFSGMGSFHLMKKHFWTVATFSLVGNLFLLIPIVGWFVGPTYSVVAGIIIAIGIFQENKTEPPLVTD